MESFHWIFGKKTDLAEVLIQESKSTEIPSCEAEKDNLENALQTECQSTRFCESVLGCFTSNTVPSSVHSGELITGQGLRASKSPRIGSVAGGEVYLSYLGYEILGLAFGRYALTELTVSIGAFKPLVPGNMVACH